MRLDEGDCGSGFSREGAVAVSSRLTDPGRG